MVGWFEMFLGLDLSGDGWPSEILDVEGGKLVRLILLSVVSYYQLKATATDRGILNGWN